MISIPVMTDETVVRQHRRFHGGGGGGAAGENSDFHTGADAARRDEESGAAASATLSAPSPLVAAPTTAFPVVVEDPAVPCSFSILDVGLAPAPLAAPVAVAPPEMRPLAQLCAMALQYRCDLNLDASENTRSCFHSSGVPSISLWDYVRRFAKYSCCTEECFIIAIVLMDRYVSKTRIPITLRNVHRLYIAAMTVSVKLRDDSYYSNAYYASIGGVANAELNLLELELLDIVQWFTWVERSVFDAYVFRLDALFGLAMPKQPQ